MLDNALISGAFQLGSAAIQAGATVGTTFIVVDAQRDVARINRNADLQIALSQARAIEAREAADTERTRIAASGVTSTVGDLAPVIFIAALILALGRD